MIKISSVYIGTTDCQYLKTQLKRKKRAYKKHSRTLIFLVAESNLRILNNLGVTLNLKDGSFRPRTLYKKDNYLYFLLLYRACNTA